MILGVEYKLAENVILSGDYGLTILKENSDIETSYNYIYPDPGQNRISSESGKRHTFSASGMGVHLGLSIFF